MKIPVDGGAGDAQAVGDRALGQLFGGEAAGFGDQVEARFGIQILVAGCERVLGAAFEKSEAREIARFFEPADDDV